MKKPRLKNTIHFLIMGALASALSIHVYAQDSSGSDYSSASSGPCQQPYCQSTDNYINDLLSNLSADTDAFNHACSCYNGTSSEECNFDDQEYLDRMKTAIQNYNRDTTNFRNQASQYGQKCNGCPGYENSFDIPTPTECDDSNGNPLPNQPISTNPSSAVDSSSSF